ncbi:pyridoxamine 5'-phosphate oxidase family protein [Dehalococcoidia bacterium]|nr:pyridoxamine 5'-phosphate oxidase family protein [Dehalococcoidia bacterium]
MFVSKEIDDFLSRTQIGVLSTVDDKGLPWSAPIWFSWEAKSVVMFTGIETKKWRNLLRLPYASLCVDWRTPPYRSVVMAGPVKKIDRPIYDLVLSMALRYYGESEGHKFAEEYKEDNIAVAVFQLEPEKIASYLE